MPYETLAGLFIAFTGLLLVAASAPVLRFAERSLSAAPQVSIEMVIWLLRGMGVILFILGLVTWRMLN